MNYPELFNKWWTYRSKWEGGVSDRPKNEDPGGYTNRGVTYQTWINGGARTVGKTPSLTELSKITADDAKKIAYELYFKKVGPIENQAIKILAVDSLWSSGTLAPLTYQGIKKGSRTFLTNTIAGINKLVKEGKITPNTAFGNRVEFLKSLPNAKHNKGWFNALPELNSIMTSASGSVSLLLIVFLLFFTYIKFKQ